MARRNRELPTMPKILPVLFALCLLVCQTASAQETQLVVNVHSGRQFRGAIDAGSSDQELVIRSTVGGVTLRRPIRWERVVSATQNGQPVTLAELKRLAEAARSQGTGDRGQATQPRRIELRGQPPTAGELAEVAPQVALVPLPSVASIAFDAGIANWDGDVETDGLVVDLFPLDAYGRLVPASGTVEVELFAAQRRTMHHAPKSGGDTLERVERWVQAVQLEDVGPSGVRLRLPFGAVHPELDFEWLAYNYGLVHVRFAVPGSGVFDASQDGVRIRPWSPNRDYLEMNTGRRFLPTENLGRRD
jgi:hypothetical protein